GYDEPKKVGLGQAPYVGAGGGSFVAFIDLTGLDLARDLCREIFESRLELDPQLAAAEGRRDRRQVALENAGRKKVRRHRRVVWAHFHSGLRLASQASFASLKSGCRMQIPWA